MTTQTDLRFAVIGSGMSGILTAIKLREKGYSNFTIYEKANKIGGTWRDNTYPGIACDVPSHVYSYSFEPNPEWSHRFAPGDEIQRYFEDVVKRHDIESSISFGVEIIRCERSNGRWILSTSDGVVDEVDFVIAATGVLHHPNIPDIEGLESFEGQCFHSARWRHDVPVNGRRVGLIGVGSTGVQITSAVVDQVAKFSLFQRTPQWMLPTPNQAYSEEEKRTYREQPNQISKLRETLYATLVERFSNSLIDADSPQMREIEEACRKNLEESVSDCELREKLRPDYRAGCKRLVMSSEFYTAIQRSNAELVTDAIERIVPEGVRTKDGRLHPLDILVLATGFHADQFMRPMAVVGRDGRTLEAAWANGPTAYLSVSIPDMPNFFMLNGPNGPVGNFSLIDVAESQIDYILQLIEEVNAGRCRDICVSREATERFEAERTEASRKTVWATGCSSWYLDGSGTPAVWPWTLNRFRELMAKPDLSAYDCVS